MCFKIRSLQSSIAGIRVAEFLKLAEKEIQKREEAMLAHGSEAFLVNGAQCSRLCQNLRVVYEACSAKYRQHRRCHGRDILGG